MLLEELMEEEYKNKKGNIDNRLIEANTKLLDKIRWIKDDIKNEIYKIENTTTTLKEVCEDLNNILEKNKY